MTTGVLTPSCLDDEAIAAAVEAGLRGSVEEHFAKCGFCRSRLTALARVDEHTTYQSLVGDETGVGATAVDAAQLGPGAGVGRYIILMRIGGGGMGVVYSAYDPELDRRIAIKVIRHDLGAAQEQLRREARAMARLTHPNVVRVYDVGAQGGLVYIAMEHVIGADLGRVIAERAPSWRDVVALCLQAGQGLAAAHAAGLVHRDIKPGNILVADDGRVLVADFGLTALARDAGARGGTPGFAAPEQLAGGECDARSDQYGLCATIAHGTAGRAPRAVERVLARGLATEPADRYASLDELLAALRRAAHRRRRVVVAGAIAGAVIALGAGAYAGSAHLASEDPAEPCAPDHERFAQLWGAPRRAALIGALKPEVFMRADHFLAALDARAATLRDAEQSVCTAGVVAATSPPGGYIRQVACLRVEAAKLDAVIGSVQSGGSIDAAHRALDEVKGGDACVLDASLLATIAPPTDEPRIAAMAAVDRLIGEQLTLAGSDRKQDGLARAHEAVLAAESIAYPPLLSRALMAESRALSSVERYDDAYALSTRARDVAITGHDDVRLAASLMRMASIDIDRDRLDEAEANLSTATALVRNRAMSPAIRVNLRTLSAELAVARGKAPQALAELDAAGPELALVADPGERGSIEIRIAQLRGATLLKAGNPAGALTAMRTATDLVENRYGSRYSGLALQYLNLATLSHQVGALDAARDYIARARTLLVGPTVSKQQLARAWQLDGVVEHASGHAEASLAKFERALALYREVYGDDNRQVWSLRTSVANALTDLGRWREAAAFHDQCLAWARKHEGETSGQALIARLNLANAITGGQLEADYPRAATALAEALAATAGTDTMRVRLFSASGDLALAQHHPADAAAQFRSARQLAAQLKGVPPTLVAHIAFRQAESLWLANQRPAAVRAATEAREMYDHLPQRKTELATVTAWLAERAKK